MHHIHYFIGKKCSSITYILVICCSLNISSVNTLLNITGISFLCVHWILLVLPHFVLRLRYFSYKCSLNMDHGVSNHTLWKLRGFHFYWILGKESRPNITKYSKDNFKISNQNFRTPLIGLGCMKGGITPLYKLFYF